MVDSTRASSSDIQELDITRPLPPRKKWSKTRPLVDEVWKEYDIAKVNYDMSCKAVKDLVHRQERGEGRYTSEKRSAEEYANLLWIEGKPSSGAWYNYNSSKKRLHKVMTVLIDLDKKLSLQLTSSPESSLSPLTSREPSLTPFIDPTPSPFSSPLKVASTSSSPAPAFLDIPSEAESSVSGAGNGRASTRLQAKGIRKRTRDDDGPKPKAKKAKTSVASKRLSVEKVLEQADEEINEQKQVHEPRRTRSSVGKNTLGLST